MIKHVSEMGWFGSRQVRVAGIRQGTRVLLRAFERPDGELMRACANDGSALHQRKRGVVDYLAGESAPDPGTMWFQLCARPLHYVPEATATKSVGKSTYILMVLMAARGVRH